MERDYSEDEQTIGSSKKDDLLEVDEEIDTPKFKEFKLTNSDKYYYKKKISSDLRKSQEKFLYSLKILMQAWEIPTPSISELDEIEKLREDRHNLIEQILIITKTNQNLSDEIIELTHKYYDALEKSSNAIESLKKEIQKLREEILLIEDARTLKFILPASWIEEEENIE